MINTLREFPIFKKNELIICALLSVIEGLCICLPYGILLGVIEVLTQPTIDLLWLGQLMLPIILILVVRTYVTQQSIVKTTSMSYGNCSTLRTRIAEHLFRVPMGFFYQGNTGDIHQLINKGVAFTENVFAHFFSQLIVYITIIVTMTISFFFLDWRLAVCLLAGVPIAVIGQVILRKGADKMSAKILASIKANNNGSMDWVYGIREHKLSGNGEKQLEQLEKQIRETQKVSLQHEVRAAIIPLLFIVLPEIGFALFIWVSLNFYFQSTLSFSVFTVFLIASVRLYSSLAQLSISLAESRFMKHAIIKVKHLLEVKKLRIGSHDVTVSGDVSVKKLNFTYENTVKAQLKNIDFTAHKGTLTAIVGSSGAGKTTLLHVLARLWPVQTNSILLDDISLEEFNDHSLYRQLALVSQDIQLFDDTVMNNLLMMKEGLTEEAVYNACRDAHCDDFIRLLPEGYNTNLGEAGNLLSGGERQRLALARALLLDAKILLLDEISSALDVKNEKHILSLLHILKKEKTLIMIAHRESLVREADQVIMLNNGEQCARGTHAYLLKTNPRYYSLWH